MTTSWSSRARPSSSFSRNRFVTKDMAKSGHAYDSTRFGLLRRQAADRDLSSRGEKSRAVLLAHYPEGSKGYKCLCAAPSRLGRASKEQVVSKHVLLGNSLLWAAAIVASAALDAPTVLTLLVLPSLAVTTWVLSLTQSKACAARTPSAA